MKIEMDHNSAVAIVACVALIVLLTCCFGVFYICEQTKQKAIGAGLVQDTVPGLPGPVWKKP